MQFAVEHVFDAAVEAVEAAMLHPEYSTFLLAHSDLLTSAAVKSFEDDGMHVRWSRQLAPRPAIERIGSKKVEPEWFEYVEQSVWDRSVRKLSFENIPINEQIASRLINRGEVTLEALAPGKTRRRTHGEIRLHSIPLLARPFVPMIEQLLAREATRLLEAEGEVMRQWLARSPLQPTIQA